MELKLANLFIGEQPFYLLIVPYGIETTKGVTRQVAIIYLLIVPYGIETHQDTGRQRRSNSFNCTLWN